MIHHARRTAWKPLLGAAFLASALAAGMPARAETTITAVMQSGVRVTDPILTTAHITRDFAYMIYDTLLGINSSYQVEPQMASVKVSEDGLTYSFTLRDGLKWHDGNPVRPEDCIASLKRWMQNDSGGQLIHDDMAELKPTGDKTFDLVLKKPFAPTLQILAKPSSLVPFMMPEKVAETPANQPIEGFDGSGPFKVTDFQPGVKVVFEKFKDYVPAPGKSDWFAGGKVADADKVVWETMPDSQTAINALMSGEIDFYETPSIDLLPVLQSNDDLTVKVQNTTGSQFMGRMNFLYPPFDNKTLRQAALAALDQQDFLDAAIGNKDYYRKCGALMGCNTPYGFTDGSESITGGGDMAKAKELLKEGHYDGTPVIIMQPTDIASISSQPLVAAQLLRKAGFNVEVQPMDWQTLVIRRASKAKPSEGGWNMFFTSWELPEVNTPLNNPMLNARGDKAWFGWPDDPKFEALRQDFMDATDEAAQKAAAEKIQAYAMDDVLDIPLGEYTAPWAWSNKLSGIPTTPFPVFWGVTKAE